VWTDSLERPGGPPEWRRRPELGGGPVFEKGVHHFDLWRLLLGDEIEQVYAAGDGDTVEVSARTRDGATASVLVCDSSSVANRVELRGDRGSLTLDLYRSDGLVQSGLGEPPGSPRLRLRRGARASVELLRHASEIRRGGSYVVSFEDEWRRFAAAVRGREEPAAGLLDGRRALEVALAARRSLERAEPVAVSS
jgi:predicted dehydrogenase